MFFSNFTCKYKNLRCRLACMTACTLWRHPQVKHRSIFVWFKIFWFLSLCPHAVLTAVLVCSCSLSTGWMRNHLPVLCEEYKMSCVCVCCTRGYKECFTQTLWNKTLYKVWLCLWEALCVCVLFWGTRVLHTNTVTLYTCYKIIIAIRCFKTKMIWHLNHLIYTAREVLSIDCQLLSLWATTVERCVVHKRVGSKSRFFVENEKSDFRWESRIFSCCCSCRQGRWARYIYSKDSKRSCTVQHKATERKGGKFGWISVILEAMKISIRARSTKNLHRHGGQLTLSLTPTDAGEVSCFDPSMSASTDLKETAGIPKQEHFFQNKWPQPNSWVLIRR